MLRRSLMACQRSFSTLVVAEPAKGGNSVHLPTLSALRAASLLKQDISVLVLGEDVSGVAKTVSGVSGVKKVLVADKAGLSHATAEQGAALIKAAVAATGATHVVGGVSSFARDVFPRTAAQLDVNSISDVVAVESLDTFKRPIYAGNAIATVTSSDKIKMFTVRPTAFAPMEIGAAGAAPSPLDVEVSSKAKFVSEEVQKTEKPQLGATKVVVSGGRGLKSGANFDTVLEPLREKLNAALGATRGAVDAGMVPNDLQVGQTGKIVAPELYVAVGISGAIQHVAGMKDSKTIVAINNDPEALIFQVSDYALVQDLFTAVPELTSKLNQQK